MVALGCESTPCTWRGTKKPAQIVFVSHQWPIVILSAAKDLNFSSLTHNLRASNVVLLSCFLIPDIGSLISDITISSTLIPKLKDLQLITVYSPASLITIFPNGRQIASTFPRSSAVKSGPALLAELPFRLICITPTTLPSHKIGALTIF